MEDFLFIYRMDYNGSQAPSTPAEFDAMMKKWQDWLGSIAAKNQLVTGGNRLKPEGKVIKPKNMVTDGPYIEMKEAVGGYSIIKAASLSDATEIAKGCPIYDRGGNVEVREVIQM